MNRLRYVWTNLLLTGLRMLPWPCPTGLRRVGNPGRDSPVLLTGNFRLTVERLIRALDGVDAHLLVANSGGVNVWCAATGGLLTAHDVVSVLKTSGIEDLVDHREVVLPQLAATGVEGAEIRRKTGWKVVWGPVRAESIPGFLLGGRDEADRGPRTVDFPWRERLEMATAWAFPISLLASLLLLPFWSDGVIPTVGLCWGLSLAIFLSFPIHERLRGGVAGPARWVVPLVLWGLSLLVVALVVALTGGALDTGAMTRWGVVAAVLIAILSVDLTGSTPTFKSGLHDDRRLRIHLEESRCKGAGFCARVCPRDVFEIDPERRVARLPRAADCVQCGACIVQCPFDALDFEGPSGDRVTPDVVRRFKLNLMGHRRVAADSTRAEDGGFRL